MAIIGLLTSGALLAVAPVASEAATSLQLNPGRSSGTVVKSEMRDGTTSGMFVVPSTAARPMYVGFQLRSASASTGYRTRARVLADGAVWVGVSRVVGGKETLLVSKPAGFTVRAGQKLAVEGSVKGTNPVKLAVRAWAAGSTKPGWQQQTDDSSGARLSGTGSVRSWAYLSSTATSSVSVGLDAVNATSLTSAPALVAASRKPSSASTGVPAGTSLTKHYGDITITKAGTVLDRMDIHGFVIVRAADVRITNSIVRGGRSKGFDTGMITDYGFPNLVISDVTVQPEFPSVYFDGIKGSDFTARRVHVIGNVDSVKIHGDDVAVQDSLLENTTYFAHDPNQSNGPTHNDNIQILFGKNLRITGNTIRGTTNFAILGAASRGNTPNLVVDGNWLDGGHCTIKLQELNGWNETASVTNNKFGPNRVIKNCAFQATPSVNLTNSSGNVYEADGRPVVPLRINS